MGGGQAHQAEIQLALLQRRSLIGAGHVLEFQFDARVTLVHRADQLRQQVAAARRHKTQAHPADFTAIGRPRRIRRPRRLVQGGLGFRQKRAAGVGQGHRVAIAVQQAYAQATFQYFDLHAQRGLHDRQLRRRPAEMQLLGKYHKGAQVLQFHPALLVITNIDQPIINEHWTCALHRGEVKPIRQAF